MKILCFIDNLGSGGAQRRFTNLAVLFRKAGHQISFLTYSEGDFFKKTLDKAEIPVTKISVPSKVFKFLQIIRFLRNFDGDVVISVMESPNALACLAKIKSTGWKLITTESSSREQTFQSFKRKVANRLERRADAKICNSERARGMWLRHYPDYADKLKVIYNPVSLTGYGQKRSSEEQEVVRLLVAASYQPIKNVVGVIEAVHTLPEAVRKKLRIDWYGRKEAIRGDDQTYRNADKKIIDYGLEKTIHLHSETPFIYERTAEADAVALFSKAEGLPNVICEGMCLGKPIVMSCVSDYRVIVNGNGILCDPHEVPSMAEALMKIAGTSEEERRIMGQKSKEMAQCLFDPAVIRDQWLAVMENEMR